MVSLVYFIGQHHPPRPTPFPTPTKSTKGESFVVLAAPWAWEEEKGMRVAVKSIDIAQLVNRKIPMN